MRPFRLAKSSTILLAGLVLALALGGASVPSLFYVARKDFPLPSPHTAFAEGDFNKDGKPDLVIANSDGTMLVLLGNGDGTFQAPQSVSVGGTPVALVVGDFNNDGNFDVAVANNLSSSTISVLLGKGDGTFQNPIVTNITSSQLTVESFLVAGDFNGDGKLDLAVTAQPPQAGQGVVTVLLGNGDGTFQSGVNYAAGRSLSGIAAGDFNRDGKQDLAALDSSGTAYVLLGKGDGTFQSTVAAATGFGLGNSQLAVADFNQDGFLDLAAVVGPPGSLSIAFGNGDGTFKNAIDVAFVRPGQSLAVGDLDGDKIPDVVVVGSGAVTALLNNGDGTMRQTAIFDVADTVSVSPENVLLADLNGDGNLDIVTANAATLSGTASISVALGDGDGTFQVAPVLGNSAPNSVVASDFNGDGKTDLAFVTQFEEGVQPSGGGVLLGNGNNTFQSPLLFTLNNGPVSMLSADFNNDGKSDLAVVLTDSVVAILLGKGDGTFQPEVDYSVPSASGPIVAGHFTSHGNLDLIVAQGQFGLSPPPLTLLPGNGDGTFGFGKNIPSNNTAVDIAAADFNGDGKTDLAVAAGPPGSAGGNVVEVFLGNGDGSFQPEIDTIVHGPVSPRSIAVGDFNHDGKTDVVVAGEASSGSAGVVAVLLGNGDGTFQPETDYAVGDGPTSITVADLNGDAIPDLVVASQGSNSVFTLLGNGDGSFQTAASWGTDGLAPFPRVITVGRFNSAAVPGIAVASDRGISLLLNKLPPSITGDFQLSTNSSSATVNAGQSATYSIQVTPVGPANSRTASFICSGAPAEASCSAAPASVALNVDSVVAVTVPTTKRSVVLPVLPPAPYATPVLLGISLILVACIAAMLARIRGNRPLAWAAASVFVFCFAALAGCGGGSSGSGGGGNGGTPAGTYTLTLTASSGTFSHALSLTLTVN